MKKICIVENNEIIIDYFNRLYENQYQLKMMNIEKFKSEVTMCFDKHDKIIVDISRYGGYIEFLNEILINYMGNRKLALLVNNKQKVKLAELFKMFENLIDPADVKDINAFLIK
ncbi:MAG: hypothetical protein JXR48_06795 [Candidatus Delongbacteria bacterium]|nr:hypothetical protein [Candidatus Delongbacteria bacterium]MBN2834658.1 hypothetical protein [Candidatus Delongbacteria bacterium]